mmetsp:Transcript_96474/g.191124  ORF Transcript_96474/g.191124 Transcript_96474/m.191124 type:complete len:94 (+) Transcript_96474:224-505(+)
MDLAADLASWQKQRRRRRSPRRRLPPPPRSLEAARWGLERLTADGSAASPVSARAAAAWIEGKLALSIGLAGGETNDEEGNCTGLANSQPVTS